MIERIVVSLDDLIDALDDYVGEVVGQYLHSWQETRREDGFSPSADDERAALIAAILAYGDQRAAEARAEIDAACDRIVTLDGVDYVRLSVEWPRASAPRWFVGRIPTGEPTTPTAAILAVAAELEETEVTP